MTTFTLLLLQPKSNQKTSATSIMPEKGLATHRTIRNSPGNNGRRHSVVPTRSSQIILDRTVLTYDIFNVFILLYHDNNAANLRGQLKTGGYIFYFDIKKIIGVNPDLHGLIYDPTHPLVYHLNLTAHCTEFPLYPLQNGTSIATCIP